MRQAIVFYKDEVAGRIVQHDDGTFEYAYDPAWMENEAKPSISLTLPKRRGTHRSQYLFPFFFNMLPEGSNKQVVCFYNRIDPDDHFSILLATAGMDNIGAVNVKKCDQ